MAYFKDSDEVYRYLGGMFQRAAEHPEAGPKLAAAGVTLQLHYSDPDTILTVQLREPIEVIEGDTDEKADIHLYMRADDADQFWRGQLNLAMALSKGRVKSKGPVSKTLRLVPTVKPLFAVYQDLIREKDEAEARP